MACFMNKNRFTRIHIIVLLFSFTACINHSKDKSSEWEIITEQFVKDYKRLKLPPIQLSFVDNIGLIKTIDSVLVQERLFHTLEKRILAVNKSQLKEEQMLEYDLLLYECKLNNDRIALEKDWLNKDRNSKVLNTRIFEIPNGKNWYRYFLKKWVDIETNPDEIFALGVKEITKVKQRMKAIQVNSGMDSITFKKHLKDRTFFYTDLQEVANAFSNIKDRVSEKLPTLFPYLDRVIDVKIEKGTNKQLAQVPGFYKDKTMFYNYFNNSFNKRQVGWLYIHEAMPGHHYQLQVQESLDRSNIQQLFKYRGVGEGWAAYIEELGTEIGAYQNIYDELGKWEWDIIRSVRVVLDVGLNYYGWSDTKALEFWQQHIKEQDDIAEREIKRMKRWPAQVITYKYGSNKILQWKSKLEKQSDFQLKEFHRSILKNGMLPYSILEKQL